MKKTAAILLTFLISLTLHAQSQTKASVEGALELVKNAWDYTVEVAPVFRYYASEEENIDELKLFCYDNRAKLDSITLAIKKANYKVSDAGYSAEDEQLYDIQKQTDKIKEYLNKAEKAMSTSVSTYDLLFNESSTENIYMQLYDSEEYFYTARQFIKKAENELGNILKKLK